jgi:hypothetical protein
MLNVLFALTFIPTGIGISEDRSNNARQSYLYTYTIKQAYVHAQPGSVDPTREEKPTLPH